MDFIAEIKQYISQLKTKSGNPAGSQEKTRTEHILIPFCEKYMQGTSKTWPEEKDYEAFRTEIDKPDNPKFAKENIDRVNRFFTWLNSERRNDTMTENEVIDVEETAETTQPELFPDIEPEADTENEPVQTVKSTAPVKKKIGRKVFDTVNGEKKSEKLMMYFTPELISEIRTWCDLKGISAVSYVTSLIEADLHTQDKKDKIAFFTQFRNNA